MINNINPFSQFRAESMGSDIWKLYVPGPFENLLTTRSLIIEGGRGSGKTMFLLCNSWREKLLNIKSKGGTIKDLLKPPNFIGIYYKVDTAFVKSMEEKNRTDWDGIFNTYFGICMAKEVLFFLQELMNEDILVDIDLNPVFLQITNLLINNDDNSKDLTIQKCLNLCENILDSIEELINEPLCQKKFKGTIVGRVILKIIESLKTIPLFHHTIFRIFIDEYETFLEYQQIHINTLIKHSKNDLIYNVGMRPKGMLSPRTSGSVSEIIQPPHDYILFRPEVFYNTEDKGGNDKYINLLREICKRRFDNMTKMGVCTNISNNIEDYLGSYDIDKEINDIVSSKIEAPFFNTLYDLIDTEENDPIKREMYKKKLASDVPIINARLHLCLLLRSPQYKPSLERLLNEYEAWKKGESQTYSDWYHNTKLGLVFLLAKEYKKSKLYYGFEVFAMLSSGVVRYFLELCEQAFDFALLNGFSWTNPRPITSEEQTKAARYVSRYKITDIESYEPFGRQLKIFVIALGDIFRNFHRNSNSTLGEPEPNHFYTNDLSIQGDLRKVINSAIMWAVIQERMPTKEKQIDIPIETVDYHLNHIYCPYFEISYRKKRKLNININQLKTLLSGDENDAKNVAREIIYSKHPKNNINKTVSYKKEKSPVQFALFDGDEFDD